MTTTTWADGFGRWHVTLPASPRAKQDALNALAAEILERSGPDVDTHSTIEYLESHMIRVQTNEPNLIEYVEYGMEADLH